jgi:hypothetical protein
VFERVVIRLSNVLRVRISGRLMRVLELTLKTPVEMAFWWPGRETKPVEWVDFVSIRPRGRIDEIARYIQTKLGASA